ncbi:hypothetical protein J2M53_00055 [Arthrobacter sp. zg-ZUI100]|uniref:hypothetical protein n=1 Tax=Arthrobacter jiangjiafuii TaxID=2817475 RepID=UPI001AEDF39A|nr:hypothetical protein [Arthrobacter jiangjiafuii]MBP3034648.1 hypothetical protein [Arthrobacter jiangjiafuii]
MATAGRNYSGGLHVHEDIVPAHHRLRHVHFLQWTLVGGESFRNTAPQRKRS